jgi:hypothetical protein
MGVVRAVAVVLLSLVLSLDAGAALAAEAGPTGQRTRVAPGAIEPQPVNQQIEEEFWAHVAEHTRRGVAAGRVVPTIVPLAHVAGRGLLSCADSEYSFAGSALDAAILLDAAEPGVTPVALPNATSVPRHPGLYSAPGWEGQILGRRIAGAWLVVEGGASAVGRERVLAHLHARAGA